MNDYGGVLIFGEITEGNIDKIVPELLGIGRRLSNNLNEELGIVFLGNNTLKGLKKNSPVFNADKIYIVDDVLLQHYQNDSFVDVMENVCRKINPRILIFGQTPIGRNIAPRLGFRLKTGVGMDCIDLSIPNGSKQLVMTRPVYGGNAMATFVGREYFPQIATVRPKAMPPVERDDSKKGDIIDLNIAIDENRIHSKVLDVREQKLPGVKLEDAEVVVCGGRGMGSEETFESLRQLADIFNGAVGATRSPCEANWVPSTLQIGLTGKIVAPNIYFAIALSGASQHLAGCSGSKTIVAINKDPEANIFRVAHYGIVGDYKRILPEFTRMIRELL